jgi:hypothetical protein
MASISGGGGGGSSKSSTSWLAKTAPKTTTTKTSGAAASGGGGNGGVVNIPAGSLDPSKTKLTITPSGVVNLPSGTVNPNSIAPSGYGSNLLSNAGKTVNNPINSAIKSIAQSDFGQYLMRLLSPTGGMPVTNQTSAAMQILSPTGGYNYPISLNKPLSAKPTVYGPPSPQYQANAKGSIWIPTNNPLNLIGNDGMSMNVGAQSNDSGGWYWPDYYWGGGGGGGGYGGGYSSPTYKEQASDYFQQLMNWSI